MLKKFKSPTTLGEKLEKESKYRRLPLLVFLAVPLIIGPIVWLLTNDHEVRLVSGILSVLLPLFFKRDPLENILTKHDDQGFMASLNLKTKTAIFDGSNLYHFGLDKNIGALPLGALVSALRSEGYRIVCFFDANIYFTLRDNHAFKHDGRRFSIKILQDVFELKPDEIYVVPKGVQADKFVIESLSHLPVSFAVTNDRFRDYEKDYAFLAANSQWRKGVEIRGHQLKLYQHKFKFPLNMK